jgi:hypothetical protein
LGVSYALIDTLETSTFAFEMKSSFKTTTVESYKVKTKVTNTGGSHKFEEELSVKIRDGGSFFVTLIRANGKSSVTGGVTFGTPKAYFVSLPFIRFAAELKVELFPPKTKVKIGVELSAIPILDAAVVIWPPEDLGRFEGGIKLSGTAAP